MYFSFTNPSYLIFLFIIPLIIFFHFYSLRHLRKSSLKFANFEAIARVKGIDIYSKNIIQLILDVMIVVALVLSISGLTLHKEVSSASFSYIIAIDSSQSMGATDFIPDRLSAAKVAAISFIDILPQSTKSGVVSFSGNTHIEQELTQNRELIKISINNIEITEIGGTDLYEAVSISSNILKNEKNKAIILLSDGQINVGNINEVIDYAVDNGIIIHTFGIGTISGGKTNFGISKIDENSLKSIAYNTKGKFFKIETNEKMNEAFKEIIPLTRKIGAFDLSFYLIILVIILFVVGQISLRLTRISI